MVRRVTLAVVIHVIVFASCSTSQNRKRSPSISDRYFFFHKEYGYSEVNVSKRGIVSITDSLLNQHTLGELDFETGIVDLPSGKFIVLGDEYIKFERKDSCKLYPMEKLLYLKNTPNQNSRYNFEWRRLIYRQKDSIDLILEKRKDQIKN